MARTTIFAAEIDRARAGFRWCVAVAVTVVSGASGAQVIELDSDEPKRGLAAYVRYLELPGGSAETLDRALATPRSDFVPLDRRYIDFGSTPNTIWLSLDLRNVEARDGKWRLSFNVRFMTEMIVYQRRGGTGAVLLHQTETSTFAERPEPFRFLTVPMALEAGERTELLIGYRSNGATALPLSIETEASFAERYARENALNIACYAAVAFLAVLSVLQALLFGQRGQLAYSAYLGATLLYIVHMDGLTFQHLWPDSPRWNSYAAIPLGLLMSAAAVTFTRSFVETHVIAPLYDKLMLALVATAAILAAAGPVASETTLKGLAYLVASISSAACLGAAVLAQRRQRPAMRFFLLGWLGVFAGVLVTSVANNFPALIPRVTATMVPKLTIMFDAFMFYMALADRARAWRGERDAAARRELDALRAEQEATARLHEVERQRLEALLLAQARSQQLAMASHDIRQPLTSLRVSLERLMAGGSSTAGETSGVRQSLDYLQKLADTYSEDAPLAANETSVDGSSFELASVLRNIDLMFRDEAEAKGLVFRFRVCEAKVRGDAIAAMRLVSNLVANAIKYTERGKVLVGCRRGRAAITIVVADTGPGIPPDDLGRLLRERERGAASENKDGHGLGLAIVTAIAARNAYRVDCRSTLGRGTAFFVTVARAGDQR